MNCRRSLLTSTFPYCRCDTYDGAASPYALSVAGLGASSVTLAIDSTVQIGVERSAKVQECYGKLSESVTHLSINSSEHIGPACGMRPGPTPCSRASERGLACPR